MLTYHGRWRVTILEKNASFDQRVMIGGADIGNGAHAGTPGSSFDVDGENWTLKIQHNDGTGWDDSLLQPQPMVEAGADLHQTINSEDLPERPLAEYDWNDFIVRVDKIGPMFEIDYRPFAANLATLEMHPDGIFVGLNGVQYMGVKITNRWGRSFHPDTYLSISTLGRSTLAAQGIQVLDGWSMGELDSTGQTLSASGIYIGMLDVGESRHLYFKVDASRGRKGKPQVQFQLLRSNGVPDPSNAKRMNKHKIFIAEVGYDFTTEEAVVAVPEGVARLRLHKIVVDRRGMRNACRDMVRGLHGDGGKNARKLRDILDKIQNGRCDQAVLKAIMALLCECLETGGGRDGSGSDGRRNGRDVPGFPPGFRGCAERFFWLPAEFEYTVDSGGFEGKIGPLPFEDPWWKIVLLVIAVIAAILAVIAAATGWGGSQQSLRIGTVGDFSTNNVDAALVSLDDSRGFHQAVADAINGEPNQNPEVALDAVIDIDPQVAAPFVGMFVIKSGARTGFTHGIITSISATTIQCRGTWDDATDTCTPDPARPNLVMNNQIRIAEDPAFGEPTTDSGDSGSLWLSNEPATRFQVVALTHSGSGTSAANPIQDVLNALNIRLDS